VIYLNEKYAVEYSVKQKHFHVGTLDSAIKNNQITAYNQLETDYLIIGIFDSHTEAHLFIDKAKKNIRK